MKTPRLTRSRTNEIPASRSVSSSSRCYDAGATTAFPIKASFDDLRSPDSRQRLREQLSNQFPDSYAASSLKSSPSTADMGSKDYLTVGQNAAAKSSSSSVDTTGNSNPDNNAAALDVEQAIALLQELKKSATPDQLVALHKALLPTRDSFAPQDQPAGQRSSLIRQKSMLPAGLATRGGASEDLLKRQEDVLPKVRKRKSTASEKHTRLQSKSSIAALDLADEFANPRVAGRAETPSDQDQPQFGGYRPGTLRITNGTASPEPGLRLRALSNGTTDGEQPHTRSRADTVRSISSGKTIVPETSAKHHTLPSQASNDHIAIQSQARQRDPSQSRHFRPMRAETLPAPSVSATTSREPSPLRRPIHVNTNFSQRSLVSLKSPSVENIPRRSLDMQSSMGSIRPSIDDGRVSPMDAPRFVKRWSHRASQISQENASDSDMPGSSFDEKTALSQFARLSTVLDIDDTESTATETPEAALSKLNGEANVVDERHNLLVERKSLQNVAQMLNDAQRPALPIDPSQPRTMPTKGDSGYVSDASRKSLQNQASPTVDAPSFENSPLTYDSSQPAFRAPTHTLPTQPDDVHSLYTLEEILKAGALQSGSKAPTRPAAARKHSSFLKLTGLGKSAFGASTQVVALNGSADSLQLATDADAASPSTLKPAKSVKKLQKKMPSVVRKEHARNFRWKRDGDESLANLEKISQVFEVPLTGEEPTSSPDQTAEKQSASPTERPGRQMPTRRATTPAAALSQLEGDTSQPEEFGAEAPDVPRTSPRRKSKSRTREKRRSTITIGTPDDSEAETKSRRSFSSAFRRRSGSATPKRRSADYSAFGEHSDNDAASESMPIYSDFGSVARALGGNPYDISTELMKGRRQTSGPILDHLQSPHQISTSQSGGLRGMDSSMASELARRKSRDVATLKKQETYERPRMATPKASQQDVTRPQSSMPSTPVSEKRSSWTSKPVFQNRSPERSDSEQLSRPHSVAESIPSVPAMPADAESRALKALEYFKRMEKASPLLASSPTPSGSSADEGSDKPGFSTMSVADAVAQALEARTKQGPAKQVQKVEIGPGTAARAISTQGILKKTTPPLGSVGGSGSSGSQASTPTTTRSAKEESAAEPQVNAEHESKPALSVWEKQAEIWRKRKTTAEQSLTKPVEEIEYSDDPEVVESPSTTPTATSRSIMPSSALGAMLNRNRRASAAEQADAYRSLIGDEPETPMIPSTITRASTENNVTVTVHSTTHTVRIESTFPVKSYQATPIRELSPGGRVETPSGNYFPYTPAIPARNEVHQEEAKRLPDNNVARPGIQVVRSTQSLDMPRPPHHQQKDTLDSIVGRYARALSPVPASEAETVDAPKQKASGRHQYPLVDRYGGGLQYGYASSGTRMSMGNQAAKKRSSALGQSHGLDLSDVPMMLRRA